MSHWEYCKTDMPALVGSRRILLPQREYYQRVLRVRPDKLVGYWPMWESGGTIAYDLSPQANNGAYTGVDLGYGGIGDHRRAPFFDGTSDFNNIYSAGLAADFSGTEGSAIIWMKVNTVAVWTDGVARRSLRLSNSATSSEIVFQKRTTNNTLRIGYGANSVYQLADLTISTTDWFCASVTWSATANAVKIYINGSQQGAIQTGLDVWGVGALSTTLCTIGASSTTPTQPWYGWLAHCAIWNVALTADEVKALAIR